MLSLGGAYSTATEGFIEGNKTQVALTMKSKFESVANVEDSRSKALFIR